MELHCAAGFEELDNALRRALAQELSPEQLTGLLQGTAGLYQDLRMEIKKRMKVFEEYALAEILQIPPGLLANPVDTMDPSSSLNDEDEAKLDEELKSLQAEISESKQRGRDIKATTQYLEKLLQDVRQKLVELETVPNVLGSTETLEKDVEFISNKGAAIEEGCKTLDSLQGATHDGTDTVDKAMVSALRKEDKTGMLFDLHIDVDVYNAFDFVCADEDVEKEVLAKYSSVKQAKAADLRAFRESLLKK